MEKLKSGQIHILKLIARDRDAAGWTFVSDVWFSHLSQDLPSELVEFTGTPSRYKAKLTEKGNNVIEAMAWL